MLISCIFSIRLCLLQNLPCHSYANLVWTSSYESGIFLCLNGRRWSTLIDLSYTNATKPTCSMWLCVHASTSGKWQAGSQSDLKMVMSKLAGLTTCLQLACSNQPYPPLPRVSSKRCSLRFFFLPANSAAAKCWFSRSPPELCWNLDPSHCWIAVPWNGTSTIAALPLRVQTS